MTTDVAQGVAAGSVIEELLACGITHAVWLVDSETGSMYEALVAAEQSGRLKTVPVCREGEAIPLAMGLLIGGKKPAIIIQNTGFFESGDALRGQAIDYELPLVMLIGYRGWRADRAAINDSAATFLEPVLDAYGVPHWLLSGHTVGQLVRQAVAAAEERRGPVAILVPGEWEAR
jgi:sulfopyruvate decarboxylase TPP-binding subunit